MTEQQEKFLESLFGRAKGDPKVAKEDAGYSTHYSIPKILSGLEEEIEKRTRQLIASSGPQAAFSILAILKDPKDLGNQMKLAAAKDLLDRAGFSKTDKIEVKTDTPLFILPSKDKDEDEDLETS